MINGEFEPSRQTPTGFLCGLPVTVDDWRWLVLPLDEPTDDTNPEL